MIGMARKIPKYEWFNPIRKKRDRSMAWAGLALYFGGLVGFVIAIGNVYIEQWTNAALFGFGGIWLTTMFAVFTVIREGNWLADHLERMRFGTLSSLERDLKRRMRK
jgi:hypothetical protein